MTRPTGKSPASLAASYNVKGHRVFSRPARAPVRVASALGDLGLGLALLSVYAGASPALTAQPLPWSRWVGVALLAWLVPWILLRVTLGRSVGEAIWRLRARFGARHPFALSALHESGPLGARNVVIASLLTLALFAGGAELLSIPLARHPELLRATELSLLPSLPITQGDAGLAAESWRVLPFYYTLGSWPASYDGRPVIYTLPYQKGPPQLFLGHLQARWGDSGKVRLTLEGPKTPRGLGSREELRSCLLAPPGDCLELRSAALSRHILEMQELKPRRWELSWFRIENAALGAESETQGFLIRAEGEAMAQDRYVLVNSSGVHQAIYLEYPLSDTRAKGVLEAAIRGLRVSPQVSEGRAWIDKELVSVKLDPGARDHEGARRLVEIQALLAAKLSVDPGVFDAYYHLAGTSILLLRRAGGEDRQAPPEDPSTAEWLKQSSYAEKSLLGSLKLYARDLEQAGLASGEQDAARVREIEAFALESTKY